MQSTQQIIDELRKANSRGQTPLSLACQHGRLEVAKWLYGAGADKDVRTADKDGNTPMLMACENGHLEVAQCLFGHGAAEDVRTAINNSNTPMHLACQEGHLEVAQWLLLHGAANNTSTGHIDEYFVGQCLSEGTLQQRKELEQSLERLQADHSNLVALVLSAVCEMSRDPLLGTGISLEKSEPNTHVGKNKLMLMRTSQSTCHLRKLRGLESSVVALIADFVGVVRGRQLRNLREAYLCVKFMDY